MLDLLADVVEILGDLLLVEPRHVSVVAVFVVDPRSDEDPKLETTGLTACLSFGLAASPSTLYA